MIFARRCTKCFLRWTGETARPTPATLAVPEVMRIKHISTCTVCGRKARYIKPEHYFDLLIRFQEGATELLK